MQAKFGYKNRLAVPRLTKVVVNSGVGRNAKDKNFSGRRDSASPALFSWDHLESFLSL